MQFNSEEFFPDEYFIKKLNDSEYLVTTSHGMWTTLNENELKTLEKRYFEQNPFLFSRLKEKNILITIENLQDIIKKLRNDYQYLLEYPKTHIISLDDINDEKIVSIIQFIISIPERFFTIRFLDNPKGFNQMHFAVLYIKNNVMNKHVTFRILLSDLNERKAGVLKENGFIAEIELDKEKLNDKFVIDILERLKKHDIEREAIFYADSSWVGKEKDLIEILKKYELRKFRLIRKEISIEEFFDFWKNTFDIIMERNKTEERKFIELNLLHALQSIFKNQAQMPCECGVLKLAYKSNGDIYPSEKVFDNEMFKLGTVYDSKPQDILFHPTNLSFRAMNRYTLHVCRSSPFSPFMSLCPVESYLETGNIIPSTRNSNYIFYNKMLSYLFQLLADEENKILLEQWL